MSTNHIQPYETFKIEKKRVGLLSRNIPLGFLDLCPVCYTFSIHLTVDHYFQLLTI